MPLLLCFGHGWVKLEKMDRDVITERCSLAIKGLKARGGRNPSNRVLALITAAISEINKRMESGFDSEESLDKFIRSIWAKVLPVLNREKIPAEVHKSADEKETQYVISATMPAEKECRWCDHGCFARTPFGCPFKCGEPPHCVGFVWDKKGEIW